ncbi:MAG: glycosyltransferase [Solirubrobacteraceae bacterium]
MTNRQSVTAYADQPAVAVSRRPTVVVPLTYAFDEPVVELLAAAGRCPDVTFLLTGSAPDALKATAPHNVTFTGWVDDANYHKLLATADAVGCLTTRSATMQTTVIEAMEYGKPTFVSGTDVLREWRGEDDTVFFISSHTPDAVSAAVRAAAAARPSVTANQMRQAIIERSATHIARLQEMMLVTAPGLRPRAPSRVPTHRVLRKSRP